MPSISELIQAEHGITATPGGYVVQCVRETPEFRRIRDMPRRIWETVGNVDEQVAVFTEWLKTEHGTQTLRPVQAIALSELFAKGGLFAPIRVGGGKTLISALAAHVVEAERPLLLVPGKLVEKTRRDLYELSKHWKIKPISIVSYTSLSRDYTDKILGGLRPDLLIADESHKLKNTGAGCTKKVKEYLRWAAKHDQKCHFVCMSGSMTTRSIKEYWHLIRWALGEGAPVPTDPMEASQWAWALDEKVNPESRWQPGALARLDPTATGRDDLERARAAYCTRLISTSGVISSGHDRPANSLDLTAIELKAPPAIANAISTMRATYETPDEHPFEMPMELWRHARELQCGFYYRWEPRAPHDWLVARKEWSEFVREALKRSHTYHTPGHLIQGILDGRVKDEGVYARWVAIRDSFEPNTVPVWIDDTTLTHAATWLEKTKGLCWVEHTCFGKRLSELTGVKYFQANATSSDGTYLEDHSGPAICALKSCNEGLNLQWKWHQNLYVSPMSKNDQWEQTLGRTHRDGQPQDEVTAEVYLMCLEAFSSLVWAVREAEYTETTMKAPQKLAYATRDFGQIEDLISRRNDKMWISEIRAV